MQVLPGTCVLALSTATATGEPRVSAVDGHFFMAAGYSERIGWRPIRGSPLSWGDVGIIQQVIDHPTASFAIKPTLAGSNVLLRPIAIEQDAIPLREMLEDPEALKLTGSRHDPGGVAEWDAAAESAFLDWYATRNDQADRLDLAIVDKARGQCVGEVVFNEWSEPNVAATSGRSWAPAAGTAAWAPKRAGCF